MEAYLRKEILVITNIHENPNERWTSSHSRALLNIIEVKAHLMERYMDSLVGISFHDANLLIQNNVQLCKQYLMIGYFAGLSGQAQLTWLLGK